jgi:molybdate transport system substrate-binding protein
VPKRIFRMLAAAGLIVVLSAGAAGAAELKVVCAGALRAVLQQLGPEFEKTSGHKLSIEYATAGKVEEKVTSDDTVDVAILTKPRADKLVKNAKLVGGTATPLARAEIGLAVKKGAPKPDIGSVEAFKKAVLAAKSVAYTDPASGGTSGIHIAQVFEKLGIAGELKPKTRLVSATAGEGSPRVGEAVIKGEAEIALQPISELKEVEGVEVVGPIPTDLQSPDLVYVAGSPFVSEQPIAAKALIDFLSGPKAKEVYKAKGLEPAG